MTTNDPITNMLIRARNANTVKHDVADAPASKMKVAIIDILANGGYVERHEFVENKDFQDIRITLKYGAAKNDHTLGGLEEISKPGLCTCVGGEDMPKVLGGLGTVIIFTNQGVIIDKEARCLGVGDEVLASIQ